MQGRVQFRVARWRPQLWSRVFLAAQNKEREYLLQCSLCIVCNGIACGRYILYIAHSRHLAVLALKLQTSMSKGYSLLNTVFLNLLTLYRLFIAWLLKTFQEGSDSANSIYQDYFIFVNCVTEQKPAAAGQLFLDRAPTLIVVSSCLFSI